MYIYLTNPPASYPTCGCCSLQRHGRTALTLSSASGHTEIVQALLTADGIDVNHVNVSIYPLTPSQVVVGGEDGGGLPHLIPHPHPRIDDLSLPNLENITQH